MEERKEVESCVLGLVDVGVVVEETGKKVPNLAMESRAMFRRAKFGGSKLGLRRINTRRDPVGSHAYSRDHPPRSTYEVPL